MSVVETGVTWACPGCGRRVPARIENCRCGTMRPLSGVAPPPDVPAPDPDPAAGAPVSAGSPRIAPPSGAPALRRPSSAPAQGFDESLRHPGESLRFTLAAIFSGLFWIALIVSLIGMFYGAIFLIASLIGRALFLAYVQGNGVEVSANQLPHLHEAVSNASRRLGLQEAPKTFVVQSEGSLNAFAMKFISRPFVIIYSGLIDACSDQRQVDFVIAHEVGHVAAGHLKWLAFLAPARFVPWLGTAYSRACEYTCDRCGLAVVEDRESADRGLLVLASGGKSAMQANVEAFMEQRLETGRFWSATVELGSTHPFLCKRVAALREFQNPGSMAPVPRNPLAYLFSPFVGLGGAAGGASLLVMVAIIGVIAAIAIPSLLRARVAANEAAAIGDARAVVSAQMAFRQMAGTYGPIDCLINPKSCVASYPATGPVFLGKELAEAKAAGYERAIVHADAQSFVFVAAPLVPQQTGIRVFCADSTGVVCAASSVNEAWGGGGTCSSTCNPLQ
jgi:Zn-dependent protease with chaperone function